MSVWRRIWNHFIELNNTIMPLTKSTSSKAFGENVKREMAAGKPQKQAIAISYAVKREAAHHTPHHSEHSAKRSEHYHKEVVAQKRSAGKNKMTRAVGQQRNDEDDTASGGSGSGG